ncbi:MAG: aminoacyl-histidine dipeptidase [Tissierellia bacterium]|jgi:dipeptidase D|nr:aminoacyl-histidine dipeptidase [Tissierellia bacterium]
MLKNVDSKRVLDFFREISKIPRCSGNEKEISDYLRNFALELDLEVIQDELLNIVIKKPGSIGYEKSPTVVLQGHMDMVCEKGTNSKHDFSKDPIELIEKEGFITGNDTTLGADDGIAVAMGMAILESDNIPHPPLELLITVREETDMSGALGLSSEILDGDMMINIDSEEEGILTVGSAGGVTVYATHMIEKEECDWNAYNVKFDGLKGGHSGMEIDKNRGNMIKVMNEFLSILSNKTKIKVGKFTSGSLDNAIPRSGEINLCVENNDREIFEFAKKELISKFKDVDGKITIEVDEINDKEVWSETIFSDITKMISEIPTGVFSFVNGSNLVESSNNLALIKEKDEEIYLEISIRSSDVAKEKEIVDKCIQILDENNFESKLDSSYPSWEYKAVSPLRDLAQKIYKKMYKEEIETLVVHAGLECGAISSQYPNMDIISIGPNITGAHTPKEKMDLKSVERVYEYVLELLKEIK